MVVPWPIIAYDRAVVKNCLWPCQGHVLRDSNHIIYYCMICTGYSLLALPFMLEPFIQFGEYIVVKYRGKPQIHMWFSWCFALALDVWKTRACEINIIKSKVVRLPAAIESWKASFFVRKICTHVGWRKSVAIWMCKLSAAISAAEAKEFELLLLFATVQ